MQEFFFRKGAKKQILRDFFAVVKKIFTNYEINVKITM